MNLPKRGEGEPGGGERPRRQEAPVIAAGRRGEAREGDQPVRAVAASALGGRRLDLLAAPGVEAAAAPVGPGRDGRRGEGLEGDQPVQGVAALDLGERRLDLLAVPGVEAVADPVGPRRDDRPAVEGHRTLLGVSHQQVTSPDRQGLHDRAHGGDLGAVRAGGQGQQVAAVADERGAGDTGSPCALRALGALPARGALGAGGAVGHAVLVSWGSVFGAGSSGSCGSGSGSISTTSSRRGPCTPSTRSSSMSLVALGPEIIVQAAAGSVFIRSMPLGTPRTTWSARAASTTITW